MSKSPRKHFWLPALTVVLLFGFGLKPTFAQPRNLCDTNVPEASSYTLVYTLPIPSSANYNAGLPPYTVDNTAGIGTFDRVAYCLQLDNDWIWVSLDAFTAVPAQVGVPVSSTGAVFQQIVSDMNVESNVGGIVTDMGIATGNIEFWHHCYITGNEIGIPGASNGVYDFGDDNRQNSSCYGSMQLHNFGAVQTLFAYNRWDAGGTGDLGIGNSPIGAHPDWTFRTNAGTYAVRTMDILVRSQRQVSVDIKFCSNPNGFNCKKKGKTPITIFGEADFNVGDIDIPTLKLCLASNTSVCTGAPLAASIADRGTPTDVGAASCAVNPDSFLDLDVAFDAQEIVALIGCGGLSKGDTSPTLQLVGALLDGTTIVSILVDDVGIDQLFIQKN